MMNKHSKQKGSVAIEFAVVFSIFFAVVYATIAYSLPLIIQSSLNHLAAEAGRAAIRVDTSVQGYEENLQKYLRAYIQPGSGQRNTWLPDEWYSGCGGSNDFAVLSGDRATICISYSGPKENNGNYNLDPVLPFIKLPVIGSIPRVQDKIEARTTVRVL